MMLTNRSGVWKSTEQPNDSESLRGLLTDLKRIDGLIHRQVQAARREHNSEDQLQGLFISEKEVDELLCQAPCSPRFAPLGEDLPDAPAPPDASRNSRLTKLAALFQLTAFEVDCLVIALAPELDLRYERLYAYLQDDVTKKWPGVDLILNLLCPTAELKIAARACFQPSGSLIRHRLVQLFEDSSQPHPPLLGRYVRIDERIVNFILGTDDPDARLRHYAKHVEEGAELGGLVISDENRRRLALLARHKRDSSVVVYLQGPYGSGKRAMAKAICAEMGMGLFAVDGKQMPASPEADWRELVGLAVRESRLQSSALYWSGFDSLLGDEKEAWRSALLRELDAREGFTFLAAETAWQPAGELRNPLFIGVELARPVYSQRMELWQRSLGKVADLDLPAVATKFRFTPGQIRDAAATARNLACQRNPAEGKVEAADVYEACRLQCNRRLSSLAKKIKPHYSWDDIILPADRVRQLREICNSVKYRSVVYDQWGFDRKLSLGKGLNILFSGPPGTGKTMAAEIIAGELALDLYKIDLSSMVSKYIGETEKNLARIFNEAETSNAILFFDEADALFGKRSEVRDSHDRYANIEVGYLLQRMEEYEGVVILATNFRKNMDEAFVRRIHCTVEFPFPDEADRRQIWETIWPKETPRRTDVDLEHIARNFEIAGGSIKNIALGAAFLAADNGGAVNMKHLMHATRREYQKMGKVVTQGEFE